MNTTSETNSLAKQTGQRTLSYLPNSETSLQLDIDKEQLPWQIQTPQCTSIDNKLLKMNALAFTDTCCTPSCDRLHSVFYLNNKQLELVKTQGGKEHAISTICGMFCYLQPNACFVRVQQCQALTLNTSEKKPEPIFSQQKSSILAKLDTALRSARQEDGRTRFGA